MLLRYPAAPGILPLISTDRGDRYDMRAATKIAVPDSNNRRATCDIRAEPARYPQEANWPERLRTATGSAIAGSIFVTSSREIPRMESVRGLGLAGRVADRGVRFRRKPNAGSAA